MSRARCARPKGWTVKANITWSDARYRDFLTEIDGRPTQLAGRHQVLTSSLRGNAGLIFAPDRGWRGSLTSNWIGTHWLNSLNTFEAPAYAVVDASLGYRFESFTLSVSRGEPRQPPRRRAAQRTGRRPVLPHGRPPRERDLSWQFK